MLQFKRDAHGGLTLYIQNESPGKDKEANWLPAPMGPFFMAMRLYWLKERSPERQMDRDYHTERPRANARRRYPDGVESEKILRSPHSVQGNPETILEVKRIMHEHAKGLPALNESNVSNVNK